MAQFLRTQLDQPIRQPRLVDGLVQLAELGVAEHRLRTAQADAAEAAGLAVLVGQATADCGAVAAAQVEVEQGVGQAPAGEAGVGAARLVELVDQAGKVELFHLVVAQRVGAARGEVGGGVFDQLQGEDAFVGG